MKEFQGQKLTKWICIELNVGDSVAANGSAVAYI
jgi:hypothetical protein